MAASLLQETAKYQSLVHDCESVFWICALSLLKSTAIGRFNVLMGHIFSASSSLINVAWAKINIVDTLRRSKRGSDKHSEHIRVNTETRKSMYYCLADLSRILDENNFSQGYVEAEEFQEGCFITLATAIKDAFASG